MNEEFYESRASRFITSVKNNICIIITIFACVVYAFYDYYKLKPNDEFVLSAFLGSFIIQFVFGFLVAINLGNTGQLRGKKDKLYISSLVTYGREVESIDETNHFLVNYCDYKNANRLKQVRINYLRRYGINYNDWINNTIDYSKMDKKQKKSVIKALRKVDKIKIFEMTPEYLTQNCILEEYRQSKSPNTETEYNRKRNLKTGVSKAVTAIVFAYLVFEPATVFSWSVFMASLIKIGMWLLLGTFQYMQDFEFITKEFRENVICRKTNYIIEFKNLLRTKPSLFNESTPINKEEVSANGDNEIQTSDQKIIEPIQG